MKHLYGRKPLEFDFAPPTRHNKTLRFRRVFAVMLVISSALLFGHSGCSAVENAECIGRELVGLAPVGCNPAGASQEYKR